MKSNQVYEPKLDIYVPKKITTQTILPILHGDGQTNESISELLPASSYLNGGFMVVY